MNRSVIPFFLPEIACPGKCIYCNQSLITGVCADFVNLTDRFEQFLKNLKFPQTDFEIAFYGGTFTCIPDQTVRTLIKMAHSAAAGKKFLGVRFSTRPDRIKGFSEIFENGLISTVELGIQSFDRNVLEICRREYLPQTAYQAVIDLKKYDIRVCVQLMTGLPGETRKTLKINREMLKECHPDYLRLYPLIVLPGTEIAEWYKNGKYRPQSIEQAASQCVFYHEAAEKYGIRVIKTGLQITDNGQEIYGPYHPNFGEIVASGVFYRKIMKQLKKKVSGHFVINPSDISAFTGYKRCNEQRVFQKTGFWLKYEIDINQSRGKAGFKKELPEIYS